MEHISLTVLFTTLAILILVSGFFSAAETGMMALNRYRLRHQVRQKNRTAIRVSRMLEHPDRLLGVVLIGNTFANIFASAITTVIAVRLFGDFAIAIGSIILTLIVLIFAEIAPKIVAVSYAQRIAFLVSLPLSILQKILYPIVWLANLAANNLLKIINIKVRPATLDHLTHEELATLLTEAGNYISDEYQNMLLAILSLEKVTVNDIMIPRNEIVGIDLNAPWPEIIDAISKSKFSRIPVYEDDINNLKGVLHVRTLLNKLPESGLTKKEFLNILEEGYFVPEGAELHKQLLQFRALKQRFGLVVDEYGEVIGLVTIEDILEEIVGEFTTNIGAIENAIIKQTDGSYLVDGGISIRELNRDMAWSFDTSGPKTLSGLITEYIEAIPQIGMCVRVSGYPVEIIKVMANKVKLARVIPEKHQLPPEEDES